MKLTSPKITVVDVVMTRPTRNVQQWDNGADSNNNNNLPIYIARIYMC